MTCGRDRRGDAWTTPKLLRGMIAILAWHEHLAGESATAMALARQALDIRVPEPDPRGDINVAVFVTDLLLRAEADQHEILDAGRSGLQAVEDWDISAYDSALLLSNVAEGWMRSGNVRMAAELIDAGPPVPSRSTPGPST